MNHEPFEALLAAMRAAMELWRPQIESGQVTSVTVEAKNFDGDWRVKSSATNDAQIARSWKRELTTVK